MTYARHVVWLRRTMFLLLAVIAGVSTPAATMAAGRGVLVGSEYARLASTTHALNAAAGTHTVDWARAVAACRALGRTTALLRTQRAACLQSTEVLHELASFPAEQRRCRAVPSGPTTGSSSTTTTPAGAGSALVRVMACMSPRYQALGHRAGALYAAEVAARRVALARGFTGRCLATLVPTVTQLGSVRRFAGSSARLAADVTLLIKVTQGKAPASTFSQSGIDADVRRFESAAAAVLSEHGPQNLAACPHA